MTFNSHLLTQKAIVYKRTGYNDYGEPSFDSGTEITCRWRDVNQLFLDASGEEFTSKAVIHPSQDVKIGDWIAKGSGSIDDAHEVRFASESLSLSGEAYYRVAI